MNDLNAFTGLVRRCVEDYDMIAGEFLYLAGLRGDAFVSLSDPV